MTLAPACWRRMWPVSATVPSSGMPATGCGSVAASSTKPSDLVAEPRLGLQHGGELAALGVGAGDDDVAHERRRAARSEAKMPAGDLPLDGDEHAPR